MTGGRRRIALQLTPLPDLLLIVIFAQYLDVGERDRRRVARADELERQSGAMQSELADARRRTAAADAALAESRRRLRAAEQTREVLGSAAARVLNVPTERLQETLRSLSGPGSAMTREETDAAMRRLTDVTAGDPSRAAWHLLQHEEMRKRVDLWRLHVSETGVATFRAGDRTFTFRADPETVRDGSVADEIARLADLLPDPRRLVLLLLTYDERVYIATLEPLREAMPALMRRLGENSDSRFDFADLGYQPLDTGL